ncbi:MAG: hypothetical protein ISR39_13690 [Akkermansiaceae bacterium]|nr:hypothetical protein [Akkermansiaceae bacterium]OUV09297.1 MAG: hypothetical protein CBC46_13450 [Verrucomicrobiaceae bacterium TMED86]
MKGKTDNSDTSRVAMASTKADLRELKSNTNATVQELQQFLRELKGKSPQEMLGVVASSQLFRSTIISVILVAIALFALTAIPYFLQSDKPAPSEEAVVTPTPAAPPSAPTPAATVPKPADPNTPESLKPLKVNETITAPSNSNPLEDKGGDFLKDLE